MDEADFALLKAEIQDRCTDIVRICERIDRRRWHYRETDEGVEAMAYQLHSLYSAFELLFESVAHSFENRIEAERYHTDLLRQMKLEIEGIRPALISSVTFALLDELRRFRHFFRHAYAAELDADKVEEVVGRLGQLRELFETDKEIFLCQLSP